MDNVAAFDSSNSSLPISSPSLGDFIIDQAQSLDRLSFSMNVTHQQEGLGDIAASSHCDSGGTHVLLSGYSYLPWLHGSQHEHSPYSITISRPDDWLLFSSLGKSGPVTFVAGSLSIALDSPILVSRAEEIVTCDITSGVEPTQVVIWGEGGVAGSTLF
jgi:hypothetical protein